MLPKFSMWDSLSKCPRMKLQQEKYKLEDWVTFAHLISLQRSTVQQNPTWKRQNISFDFHYNRRCSTIPRNNYPHADLLATVVAG